MPICGLLIPNPLYISNYLCLLFNGCTVSHYLRLCYLTGALVYYELMGVAGRPAGQELLRQEMVDLASLFCKNDVAYKAYTRVLSHTCDAYWGRKLDIGRPNGRNSDPQNGVFVSGMTLKMRVGGGNT